MRFIIGNVSFVGMLVVELTIGNVGTGQCALPAIFDVLLMHVSLAARVLVTYQVVSDCTTNTRKATHPIMRNNIAELFE